MGTPRELPNTGVRVLEDGDPEKIFTDPDYQRTREFLQAVLHRT